MKEHTLSWEEINKTNTNSTQRCISQWSYKVCWKRNPNKVRNSSIYVFITLKKFGPEFTKCLVPNTPGPENIWSRIHQLVPSSLGPEFTWSRIHLIPHPLVGRTSSNRRSVMRVLAVIFSITYHFFFICKYISIQVILSGREIYPLLMYPSTFLVF